MIRYNIPIGISEFEKIRKNNYYYVDKTELIRALVKTEPAEITLFTRPRRFGKTLVMSMQKAEERALNQIDEMRYADSIYAQGYQKVIKYGAAFYRKSCLVGRCEV